MQFVPPIEDGLPEFGILRGRQLQWTRGHRTLGVKVPFLARIALTLDFRLNMRNGIQLLMVGNGITTEI
jgi:hypothetical protein